MKRMATIIAAAVAVGMAVAAEAAGRAATNAPAGGTKPALKAVTNAVAASATQAVAAVEAPALPAAPAAPEEWTGYVRVLTGSQGDVRAARLVTGDKLIAVDLNEKGRDLAKTPKTCRVLVKGFLEQRQGRSWLVVSDFQNAPDAPPPAPAASTNAPPAAATAPDAPPPASSNAVPTAATNAPAIAPVP